MLRACSRILVWVKVTSKLLKVSMFFFGFVSCCLYIPTSKTMVLPAGFFRPLVAIFFFLKSWWWLVLLWCSWFIKLSFVLPQYRYKSPFRRVIPTLKVLWCTYHCAFTSDVLCTVSPADLGHQLTFVEENTCRSVWNFCWQVWRERLCFRGSYRSQNLLFGNGLNVKEYTTNAKT